MRYKSKTCKRQSLAIMYSKNEKNMFYDNCNGYSYNGFILTDFRQYFATVRMVFLAAGLKWRGLLPVGF